MASSQSAAAAIGGIASGVTDALQDMIGQMERFVAALNPALMQQFGRAMADLQATVGTALQPIFQVLTGAVREMASAIMPLMQTLRPIVEQLASALSSALLPIVKMVADVLQSFAPLLSIVALNLQLTGVWLSIMLTPIKALAELLGSLVSGVLAGFADVLKVVSVALEGFQDVIDTVGVILHAVFQTLQEVIAGFLKSLLGDTDFEGAIDTLKKLFHDLARAMLLFSAHIAKLFGQTGFIDNLIKGLQPGSGASAGGQTSITSFSSLSRDLATRAAMAADGGLKKSFDLSDVVKELQELKKDGPDTLVKQLTRELQYMADQVIGAIENLLPDPGHIRDDVNQWKSDNPILGEILLGGLGRIITGT